MNAIVIEVSDTYYDMVDETYKNEGLHNII